MQISLGLNQNYKRISPKYLYLSLDLDYFNSVKIKEFFLRVIILYYFLNLVILNSSLNIINYFILQRSWLFNEP